MRDDDDEKRTAMAMVRLRPSFKAEMEAKAREDGRSLSSWIEQAMAERAARQAGKGA